MWCEGAHFYAQFIKKTGYSLTKTQYDDREPSWTCRFDTLIK